MQLNSKTDYAARITIYLAEVKEISNAEEISTALWIPRSYVPKALKGLIDFGIIASKEGAGGGYYLAKRPQDITLLDIYLSCEPTTKISRCLETEHYCPRQGDKSCLIQEFYLELQEDIKELLQKKTIDLFCSRGKRMQEKGDRMD